MSPFLQLLRRTLAPVAAGVLGLASGALLTEAVVLVPWWCSMEPEAFLAWYADHARTLFLFFAPLEIVGALLAVAAAAFERAYGDREGGFLIAAAFLSVAVLAAFPLYFGDVNAAFAAGTIPLDEVQPELTRWAGWHWARTVLELAAFASALLSIRERWAVAGRGSAAGQV